MFLDGNSYIEIAEILEKECSPYNPSSATTLVPAAVPVNHACHAIQSSMAETD